MKDFKQFIDGELAHAKLNLTEEDRRKMIIKTLTGWADSLRVTAQLVGELCDDITDYTNKLSEVDEESLFNYVAGVQECLSVLAADDMSDGLFENVVVDVTNDIQDGGDGSQDPESVVEAFLQTDECTEHLADRNRLSR